MEIMFSAEAISIFLFYLSFCETRSCDIIQKRGPCYVNCSSRGLKKVPNLPKKAFSVDLSKNNITMLVSDLTFSGMTELSYLDLSDNPLEYLSSGIFNGLANLTSLHIRNNLLYNQEYLVLDELLFGLRNLNHFSFTLNYWDIMPHTCKLHHSQPFFKVDALDSIETLEIDTALLKWRKKEWYRKTDSKIKSLHLINGQLCFYYYLSEKQLDYMPFLENCTIEYPYLLSNISYNMFYPQKSLKALTIYGHRLFNAPQAFIFNVTKSIVSKKGIESLTIQNLYSSWNIQIVCGVNFRDLHFVNSLQTISLAGNNIREIVLFEGLCFPFSMKRLYLQRNCLSNFNINLILASILQLEIVEAGDQNSCEGTSEIHTTVSRSLTRKIYNLQKLVFTFSKSHLDFGDETDYFKRVTHLDLSHNDKVQNTIPHFFSENRPNLEYLDISHCQIVEIQPQSFENFTKLKYLDFSWNNLGKFGCSLWESFYHMKALINLDLSSNNIKCIPLSLFNLSRHIEKLLLSANDIQIFEPDMQEQKALNHLDISHNKIQKLSEKTFKVLDILSKSHEVSLNLVGNILICTCETIGFLRWIASTKVILIDRGEYVCSYNNGTTTKLEAISDIIETLTVECTPKTTLIVGIAAGVASCLTVIVIVITYRCRWRLRYWYYKFRIKTSYQTRGNEYERIFEYDMFISYPSEDHQIARTCVMDELELKRGLRCCIHERDFLPGETIAYNIARSIRVSKRTALFLSKNFLKSEWCLYEMHIARMEALHSNRKVVLVIMLDKIPSESLPLDIFDMINTFTYLEYPREGNESDLDIFWSRCADFAKD